jgi:hypothetical protein
MFENQKCHFSRTDPFIKGVLIGGVASAFGSAITSGINSTLGTAGSFGELSLGQQLNMSGALQGNLPTWNGVAQGVGNGLSAVFGSYPP